MPTTRKLNLLGIAAAAILVAAASCQERKQIINMGAACVSFDSTSYGITDTICLPIGDYIQPYPYYTATFSKSNRDFYLIADGKDLFIFDLDSLKLVSEVYDVLPNKLTSLSSIQYVDGVLWIYDYKSRCICGYDDNKKLVESYDLNIDGIGIDPWGMPDCPIVVTPHAIFLSGIPNHNPYVNDEYRNTSLSILRNSGKIIEGGPRPFPYNVQGINMGIDNLWRTYHGRCEKESIVVSCPYSSKVQILNSQMQIETAFEMGSRYFPERVQLPSNTTRSDDGMDKEYYLKAHTYRGIVYDAYQKRYYRIATHPLNEYVLGTPTIKPFSVIVGDVTGNLICETSILKDGNKYMYDRIFAGNRGLYMQIRSEDERFIKFVIFNETKNEDK